MRTEEIAAHRAAPPNEVTRINHSYSCPLNPNVHIYTSCQTNKLATGIHASIVLSADYRPFELSGAGITKSFVAVAVGPSVSCGVETRGIPLVSVCLEPVNEHFRAFRALRWPGVLPLDRASFSALDRELHAARCGDLPVAAVSPLIDKILAIVGPLLPKSGPQNTRMLRVCELVRGEPNLSLRDIATTLGMSYDHATHLFTQAIGLPFRNYRLWYKMRCFAWQVCSGKTLTAAAHGAGFTDSAHACRTFQKLYGRPPSYFFDGRFVDIHTRMPQRGTGLQGNQIEFSECAGPLIPMTP